MKNFKSILVVLTLALVASVETFAQQVPIFTQSRENDNIVNPASVTRDFVVRGSRTSIGATYRTQWVDLEGAPNTQSLRFSHFIEDKSLHIGANILNDKSGLFSNTGVYVKGAYQLDIGGYQNSKLTVGLTAGAVQYRIGRDARLFDESENFNDNGAQIVPDIGIGAYFFNDLYYVGLSIPQTFGLTQSFEDLVDGQTFEVSRVQHIFFSGGAYFLVDDYTESYIEPNLQVRFVGGAPVNLALSARYRYNDIFFVGAGYQTSNTGSFEAGLLLNEDNIGIDGYLQLGYGYGTSFTDFGPAFGATHEINLTYSFGY